jgi:UDP:flavonoid glycosyltransferase YjiC (YdhE family)
VRLLAACSLGGAGHLQPLLPFLAAAEDQGHEVLVTAPPALADMIAAAGYDVAAGGEPQESEVGPIREQLPVLTAAEAAVLGNRELFGTLATRAMLPAVRRVVTDFAPDLVLRDPCENASAIVAAETGCRVAQVGIGLAEVEWGSIDVAAPALEAQHAGIVAELRHAPYVTRFPASLDASRFVDTRRYCEPLGARRALPEHALPEHALPEHALPEHALPEWWTGDAPSSVAGLILISFGTVLGHMSMAADVYRVALEAAAGLDARVLLTVGRRFDRSQLGAVPPNVHVEAWVDQADVFAEAEVVVSHGGSGTTLGALRAGIPVVVVPLFADQPANGARVAATGAGIVAEIDRAHLGSPGSRRQDATRIRDAIETVRTQPSYRARAEALATEMGSAPSVGDRLAELLAV